MQTVPRHSAFFAMREARLSSAHRGAIHTTGSGFGPGYQPAYSQDSDIVACAFQQSSPQVEGALLTRRIPEEDDGKQMTSLRASGGVAWCPTNNKFYCGMSNAIEFSWIAMDTILATAPGLVAIVDPLTDAPQIIGTPSTTLRPFFHPDAGDIWIGGGGSTFKRINVSDNSITAVTGGGTPLDSTFCASNSCVYFVNTTTVYKADASGTVTTIFTEADFETLFGGPVTGWLLGAIEYVDSIDRVVFAIKFTSGGTFQQLLKINPSDDSVTNATTAGGSATQPWATIMYYSPQFDRLIAANQGGVGSYDPADFSTQTATLAYGMTAKGCFCDSVNKVGIPGLDGVYQVKFYGAADL